MKKLPKKFKEMFMPDEMTPDEQEFDHALRTGGKRVTGSGRSQYAKGDSANGTYRPFDGFLTECKQTGNKSYRLTTDVLTKITKEALAAEKYPAMDIYLKADADPILEKRWVAIPLSVFEKMKLG